MTNEKNETNDADVLQELESTCENPWHENFKILSQMNLKVPKNV